MKIIVYPHSLEVGGSQRNALETAAELQARGNDVVVFAVPGALLELVQQLRLRFVPAPLPHRRPSRAVVRVLADLVRQERADIVHAHEWPPGLEAYLAVRRTGARAVCSVMSMSVARFLPDDLPVVVGTAQMAEFERLRGRSLVGLVEPCVDVQAEQPLDKGGSPRAAAVSEFRKAWQLEEPRVDVVAVGRLVQQLKLEGILHAVRAIGELAADHPVRLVLVGGGAGEAEVRRAAAEVNARRGPGTVVLTGELLDPSAGYDAADVVLGMGSSALRAMARAKPLVVQGERGFFRRLEPASLKHFSWVGWYGVGEASSTGPATLSTELAPLIRSVAVRKELGAFARRTAENSYSVEASADATEDVYAQLVPGAGAADSRSGASSPMPMVEAAARYSRYELRRQLLRRIGREAADDANAMPVAARPDAPPAPAAAPDTATGTIGPHPRRTT